MTHTPTRTPLQSVEEVGLHRGRRILAAKYPSATSDATWTTTLDDSGHVIGCDCPAGRNGHACWHNADAANAVVAYFMRAYANMNERQLTDHAEHLQRYLGYPLDREEREAAELEHIAVRQLRAKKQEAA